MPGYKNFMTDVKMAFEKFIVDGSLKMRDNEKIAPAYHAVMESKRQYIDFTVENLSLLALLVEKKSFKFIVIDELLDLLGTNIKEEKAKYFDVLYQEKFGIDQLSDKEATKTFTDHICLGDLYTYSKLMDAQLSKFVFDANESWVEFAESKGHKLYKAKINGINV